MLRMAKGMQVQISEWSGNLDVMVIAMDDFDIILDNNFLMKARVSVVPHLSGLLITDSKKPCFIEGFKGIHYEEDIWTKKISAM